MFKIALMGVENSHANSFLTFIKNGEYPDVEVKGIYSYDTEVMKKISEEFSVPTMENYDSLVGQVDGIVVTARHGSNHYKYAKPYIESGIPMFIDKPITSDVNEAKEFMAECKKHNVRVTGGSMLKHAEQVKEAKNIVEEAKTDEKLAVIGGLVCAPIALNSMYDGFWFYSQHLIETLGTVFGYDVKSVLATQNDNTVSVVFRYADFDVFGNYAHGANVYHVDVIRKSGLESRKIDLNGASKMEFEEFYQLLNGGKMEIGYDDFIKPVYLIDAIIKSMETNTFVEVNYD